MVIVPGGNWAARTEAGAWGEGEGERGDWLPLLKQAATNAVMTGGLFRDHAARARRRGRHATSQYHHTAWDDLQATGASLVTDRVVDDGDLITAGGVTSGLDLALWVVERYATRGLADTVAERMEYHRTRPMTLDC